VSFRFHRDGGFHGYFRDAQAKLELGDAELAEGLGIRATQLVDWKSGHVDHPRLPDAAGRLLILFGCGLADLADVTDPDGPDDRWQRLENEELRLLAANAGYQPSDWNPPEPGWT
jgi:hypothetical protein